MTSAAAAPGAGVLVLGVGNLLLGDDGVGPVVAQELHADPAGLPVGVRVLDGGTLGLELTAAIDDRVATLVLVDAAAHGGEPGDVATWTGEEVARVFDRPMSVHQAGVESLLGALTLMNRMPARVVVVGVEPASTEPGVGLSAAVAAAVPEACARVVAAARGA